MKKIISILALVLAMTMLMSVSAFAAKEFSVDETAAAAKGVTLGTVDADSIDVTVPTTSGADYSILLVKGSTLPTVDSDIAYINQIKADAATETFEVLPLMSVAEAAADGNLMLYIGTNATGKELIDIPVTYKETAPTGCNVTLMNGTATVAATLATDADGNVTLPADTAWNGATPVTGNTFNLYSWVSVDTANKITVEYLAGAKVAATALEGKTLYSRFATVLASGKERKIGDINGDGNVRATDYQDLKMGIQRNNDYAYVKEALYSGGRKIGDVNGDGNVRATDYQDLKMGIQRNNDYAYVKDTLYIINK